MKTNTIIIGMFLVSILVLSGCSNTTGVDLSCSNECTIALGQYSRSCMDNCVKRFGHFECNNEVSDDCKSQVEPVRRACLTQCGYVFD